MEVRIGASALFFGELAKAYITRTMTPQLSPFITPLAIVAPEIPKKGGTPVITTKPRIISPGGKKGITIVTANKQRKATAKTSAFDMVDYYVENIYNISYI